MEKSIKVIWCSLIVCTGLLTSVDDSMAMGQNETPPFVKLSSLNPGDTQDAEINITKSEFHLRAAGNGVVLQGLDAEAYFLGPINGQSCFTFDRVIACRVFGPMRLLLVYQDDSKYFELESAERAFCYTGRRGVFCDIY